MPYQSRQLTRAVYNTERYVLHNYIKVFWKETTKRYKLFGVKKALMRGNPVIINLQADEAFDNIELGQHYWTPNEKQQYTQTLLIVGYDENKKAFEVMNSRGAKWGNRGCIWIRYVDFGKYAGTGVVLIPNVNN